MLLTLSGVLLYAVLVATVIKRGREGRLRSCDSLLVFGGISLAVVGGFLFGLVYGPFQVSSGGSQELGFVLTAMVFFGGGGFIAMGALIAVAGAALKLAFRGEE